MSLKILVIDDEQRDFLYLKENLAKAGIHDLSYAASGEEGVALAQKGGIDMVILDTVMKGMDGFQTCRKLKEIDSGRIKVIMFTGLIDAVDAGHAREMGADDYCVKTFDFEALIASIRNFGNPND